MVKEQEQGVNTAFLDEKHWEKVLEKTQYIDLAETSIDVKTLFPYYDKAEASRGFLIKAEDLKQYYLLINFILGHTNQ
jgi:hypothetical protein